MSGISYTSKSLLAILVASAALVGCGRKDVDQAATDQSSPRVESQAPTRNESHSSGMSSDSGTSSSGSESAIGDSVITTKAKTALLADTTVKGSDINVETDKGIVSLTGSVKDSRQKERAVSIVRGINGVKSVRNELTVQK